MFGHSPRVDNAVRDRAVGRHADVGEMERRKALVFVMAIVVVVLAAVTLAITTATSNDDPGTEPQSITSQVSSSFATGGSRLRF